MSKVLAPHVHAEHLTDAVATHADPPTPLGVHVADFLPFLPIAQTPSSRLGSTATARTLEHGLVVPSSAWGVGCCTERQHPRRLGLHVGRCSRLKRAALNLAASLAQSVASPAQPVASPGGGCLAQRAIRQPAVLTMAPTQSRPHRPPTMPFSARPSTYRIEPAPSGRARCRRCRRAVPKGGIRIAITAFVCPGRSTLLYRCALPACLERRPRGAVPGATGTRESWA